MQPAVEHDPASGPCYWTTGARATLANGEAGAETSGKRIGTGLGPCPVCGSRYGSLAFGIPADRVVA